MPILKRKKKKEPVPEPVVREDPKKQLDVTRQNMMKICDALESVNINKIRSSVSEEVLPNATLSEFDRDLKIVKAVISKQTSSQLMLAESDPIDQELFFFAELIGISLKLSLKPQVLKMQLFSFGLCGLKLSNQVSD